MKYRWIHIGLAALVYISTMGVSVHQHFCQDELKNVAFWTKAEACHQTNTQCLHHPTGEEEKKCCDDQVSYEVLDVDMVTDGPSADLKPQVVALSPPAQWVGALRPMNGERPFQIPRAPPPPERLYLLFQSFLC